MLERFEQAEGRNPGETSIADLPGVLKLKKELCEAEVSSWSFFLFSLHREIVHRLISDILFDCSHWTNLIFLMLF